MGKFETFSFVFIKSADTFYVARCWIKYFYLIILSTLFFTSCSRVSFVELLSINPGNVSLKNGLGVNVSNYPVAVVNVNGAILGIALNDTEYVNLWNADASNSAQGHLEISDVVTQFKFTPNNPNDPIISQVSAMRFFQFDLTADHLDSMSFPDGSIADFGDGSFQKFDAITPLIPSVSFYRSFSGAVQTHIVVSGHSVPGSSFTLSNTVYVVRKDYVDASPKTITIYHNDNDYYFYNDNMSSPAGLETAHLMTNLRGNLPVYTKGFQLTSTQQASFNTFTNLNLNEFVNHVEYFSMRWGYSANYFENYNFGILTIPNLKAIDFGANVSTNGLVKVMTGTADLVAKYPHLIGVGMMQSQYSPDLNLALPNVQQFIMTNYGTGNILLPADYDRILNQLASVKANTGGKVYIDGGNNRTSASDAAVTTLQAQGVTVQLTN